MELNNNQPIIATFSIVGCDPATGEVGVAVQSKFLGVGSVVPWAKAGVGAVATQAFANPAYGPEGLRLLEEGSCPDEVIQTLTSNDEDFLHRQVGVIDAKGNAATFTGEECYDWAGDVTGKNYAAQGNILVNRETVTHMGDAFENTEGPLADRLIAGLKAAQNAGGDSRGKQSAAIYVVKKNGGYGGLSDVFVDLRVDDHPEPIEELDRIYQLQQLYFGETEPYDIEKIEGKLEEDLRDWLVRLEYLTSQEVSDDEFHQGLTAYLHTENFEAREQERGYIDMKVYEFMKTHV
ncbi:fimbrial assembly protein FimA [Halobacillus mangrovi]|uniref:Fimbrial assembly protein FimA n=2 Tax=Halobacillus mangrovi TaxID=402384 RepID=A0A1W5ZWP9_9BACI|nr:fimbrial assembly protein FimA [Halobacillus mangrovi]